MKTKKTIDIDSEDFTWFQKEYPNATLSWIVSLLLREFRTTHSSQGFSLNQVIKNSMSQVKDQLDEGIEV